jgi:hypothetical protein
MEQSVLREEEILKVGIDCLFHMEFNKEKGLLLE